MDARIDQYGKVCAFLLKDNLTRIKMKHKFLLLAALMLAATILFAQSADSQTKPSVNSSHECKYRKGELIVKFSDASGVSIRRNAKGRFTSAQVSQVDAVLQDSLGVFEVEDLMPLTGARVYPRKVRQANGKLRGDRDMSRLCLVYYDTTKVENVDMAIAALEKLDAVEYVEPNYLIYPTDMPESYSMPFTSAHKSIAKTNEEEADTTDYEAIYTQEPLYSQQWGPAAVNLPWLWKQPIIHKKRPVIAIIDSGVELDHPDLRDNIWNNEAEVNGVGGQDDDNNGFFDDLHGYDFVYKTGVITDRLSHGTFCAGIAAAKGDNGLGITGANPNALIMPLVVLDKSNFGTWAWTVQAIDYAVANGADILSMSLGGNCYSQALEEALWKAFIAGKYLVSSAANDNKDIYDYDPLCVRYHSFPAAFKFVLGVEASTPEGSKAGFSNFDSDGPIFSEYDQDGPTFFGDYYNYELRAPGTNIISTHLNGTYQSGAGTSFSTPLIAGGLSRLLQCRDYSSQENLAGLLIQTSDSVTHNVDFKAAYEFDELAVDPALVVTHYTIVDTIAGGNGDGLINPGEIIEIYPTIKCIYGQANGIRVSINRGLNVDTTTLTILKNDAKVGMNLSPGATIRCLEPIIVKVAERCGDGYTIQLYPTIEVDSTETINMASCYAHRLILEVDDKDILRGLLSTEKTIGPDKKHIIDGYYALTDSGVLNIKPGTTILMKNVTALAATRGHINAIGKPDSMIVFTMLDGENERISYIRTNHSDTIKYAIFRGFKSGDGSIFRDMILENCIIEDCGTCGGPYYPYLFDNCELYFCNLNNNDMSGGMGNGGNFMNNVQSYYCNIVHNLHSDIDFVNGWAPTAWSVNNTPHFCNIFGNTKRDGTPIYAAFDNNQDIIQLRMTDPSYFGSADITEVRKGIWDIYQNQGLGEFILDNMLISPAPGAHGVVAKVLVDSVEINNNYRSAPPVGVGTHRFDVVYNRPMDVSINPVVSFGVREPYTQHVVANNAQWSSDSTIYSAEISITGRTLTDGVNTVLIKGGRDNDKFAAIEEEGKRFQLLVQAVGSLSTGLAAEPGLGKVTLTWRTDEEDFDDLMGYNIYRWTEDTIRYDGYWNQENSTWIPSGWKFDTIVVNEYLLDKGSTQYVDFAVTPGKVYYYTIQQITSALTTVPMSNPVSVIPLTSIKGDANGSMAVDVADVVTEVAYLTNQNPQPFIFDAADVNSDSIVNILDVVGTINIITHPEPHANALNIPTAYYYLENGILYVESNVVLGGVQFTFDAEPETMDIRVLEALHGSENVGVWTAENNYMFMAYSMSGKTIGVGKTALLQIGNAELTSIVLSDSQGHNVVASPLVGQGLNGETVHPGINKVIENNSVYIIYGEHKYNILGIEVK